MTKEQIEVLEKLIDSEGLTEVFDAISEICYLKAEHILTSYNDAILSNQWQNAGLIVPNANVILPS